MHTEKLYRGSEEGLELEEDHRPVKDSLEGWAAEELATGLELVLQAVWNLLRIEVKAQLRES